MTVKKSHFKKIKTGGSCCWHASVYYQPMTGSPDSSESSHGKQKISFKKENGFS